MAEWKGDEEKFYRGYRKEISMRIECVIRKEAYRMLALKLLAVLAVISEELNFYVKH